MRAIQILVLIVAGWCLPLTASAGLPSDTTAGPDAGEKTTGHEVTSSEPGKTSGEEETSTGEDTDRTTGDDDTTGGDTGGDTGCEPIGAAPAKVGDAGLIQEVQQQGHLSLMVALGLMVVLLGSRKIGLNKLVSSKAIPSVATFLGAIVFGIGALVTGGDPMGSATHGALTGAASSGLWDLLKAFRPKN